ncbi:STAS domain-containing protein [uncultured Bilophila sp.]|uniref:STAS domain-containing protein n=1 Tax=uncultured Bilophila sp. TaxID=529385 RepID=UPI0025EC8212|nr:STAS domain-containing protein [uncultured Bilophila sp.]
MQAVISEQGCVSILALSGRMDATTASVFDEACRSLLDGGAKKIVVDLAGIEYISSAGLRVILTMVKASKGAVATLAFCSMQSMVAEVFKISGFSSMLPIYATRDEAVSALS